MLPPGPKAQLRDYGKTRGSKELRTVPADEKGIRIDSLAVSAGLLSSHSWASVRVVAAAGYCSRMQQHYHAAAPGAEAAREAGFRPD